MFTLPPICDPCLRQASGQSQIGGIFMSSVKKSILLSCAICGNQFMRKPSEITGRDAYCSLKCAGEGYKIYFTGKNSTHYSKVEVQCAHCKTTLVRKKFLLAKRKNHFCSRACFGKWKSQNAKGRNSPHYNHAPVICAQCGNEFLTTPARINNDGRNFCNSKCFGRWLSDNRSGDNNHLWKGGRLHYYGPNWQHQRKKARERDSFTCQHCGIAESDLDRELDVHHITPFREFGIEMYKKANDLSNLICLCVRCHKIEETRQEKVRQALFHTDNT